MIHFLCALPYEGLRDLMNSVSNRYPDIRCTSFVCTIDTCLKGVSERLDNNTDAIITRGNMAELLSRHFSVPVFKIPFTSYDILRTLRAAWNIDRRFVFIGSQEMIACARTLCDLLQYTDARFESVDTAEEVYPLVERYGGMGYRLFAGDRQVAIDAGKLNFNCVEIISGTESLSTALEQATVTARCLKTCKESLSICASAIDALKGAMVILDSSGRQLFPDTDRLPAQLLQYLKSRTPRVAENGCAELVKTVQGVRYRILGRRYKVDTSSYYIFQLSELPRQNPGDHSIQYSSDSHEIQQTTLLWGNSDKIGSFIRSVERYTGLSQALLFVGEEGTENDELVKYIYLNSPMNRYSLTVVDCAKTRPGEWNGLFENYNSPLYKTGGSIYLKNVNALTFERLDKLLAYFDNTDIFRRLKIMLGFSEEAFTAKSIRIRYANFLKRYIIVRIPPLREHAEDIGYISNLYINGLNLQYGKQVVGVERSALEAMEKYPWPQNITQLKQVLSMAVLNSSSSYLTDSDVVPVIEESAAMYRNGLPDINLNQTMRQIEKQIAEYVLRQENFNQSKVAKKLNISRTTLWRLLNE